MRTPTWLTLGLALLALSANLFLAPRAFEGPSIVRLSDRHAITGTDLIALLPLLAGGLVLLRGHAVSARLATRQAVPGTWLLGTGLALGLAFAARFPYLPVHWPLAILMLGLVTLAVVARAWRS
jgi:hypothetical protein